MRVLFLGNGAVGLEVARLLARGPDPVVGAVLNGGARARQAEEIVHALGLTAERCFDGARLGDDETLATLRALDADVGVSALFGHILRPPALAAMRHGCVNVHPSYLPYGRGAHPNVWSIVEGTPAGATVHWIDEGVDTGSVILQRRVPVEPVDTGETLYRKLERACVDAFADAWPLVRSGCAPRRPQDPGAGTSHRVADLARLDDIDLDRSYTARELIDRLRARTFPPHAGARFVVDGRRVEIRVELRYVD